MRHRHDRSTSAPRRAGALCASLCLTAAGWLVAASPASALTDFTWSGADPSSPLWSMSDNWAGNAAPSGSVGTLSFPALTSAPCLAKPRTTTCYSSQNDVSGLQANALTFDDGVPYTVQGNAIAVGAGGITAAPSANDLQFGPSVHVPITLTAAQTWSITGGPKDQQLNLDGGVSGASDAVTITFASNTFLGIGNAPVDVGPVTASGHGTIAISSGGTLNGSDGNAISLSGGSGLFVSSGPTPIGPITDSGGQLQIGQPGESALANVTGDVTLQSGASFSPFINAAGTVAGTDFSRLAATGSVNISNTQFRVDGSNNLGNCPVLHVGDVDQLLSAGGTISGTFAGTPNNTVIKLGCSGGTQYPLRINYSAHAVTATVLAPLSKPLNLQGTPGDSSAYLTWAAPAQDGGTPITGYRVQYSSDGGTTWHAGPSSTVTSTETLATVTGLTNGTGYQFRVAAINHTGQGPYTAASAVITPAAPSVAVSNVAPGAFGRGAFDVPMTITGSGFTNDATVTVSGTNVTASSVDVVSPTQITADFTVKPAAALGKRNLLVTEASGVGTCAGCVTINPAPTATAISPSTLGKGATRVPVTITGTGFTNGAKFTLTGPSTGVFGTVTAVSATSLTATLTVKSTATTGSYTLHVTNGDGGKASCANCLSVVTGPSISGISPTSVNPGQSVPFTATGTGFSSDATLKAPPGTHFTGVAVNGPGTQVTATLVVSPTAPAGSHLPVTVANGPIGHYGAATDNGLTIT